MAGRVPTAALCCCSRQSNPSVVIKTQSALSGRCFTTTASQRKHGSVPKLTVSTDAPEELLTLLEKVRNNIFVPAQLRRPLQNLVYRTKNQGILTSDPISVTLGSEDFTLHAIDRTRDVPDSWKSLLQAMDLMGTSVQDWRGPFLGLLEGFRIAGRRWKVWQWELLIRRAGERGMAGAIVEAARRGKRTGLSLRNVRLAREAFWACRELAARELVDGDEPWSEARTEQALRFAEQLAELMEMDVHCGDAKFRPGDKDPRSQVDCMGLLLELAAVRAQKHLGGVDVDGKVRLYAERLAANLGETLDESMDPEEAVHMSEGRQAAAADYELSRWGPVAHAIEVSNEVLGTQTLHENTFLARLAHLNGKIAALADQVAAASDEKPAESRRGFKWVKDLGLERS